jgi:hypothetical protein
LTDQTAVGYPANPADPEALGQTAGQGQQGLHVGGVPRPQFTADRLTLSAQHRADPSLPQVWAVVLTVAVLS